MERFFRVMRATEGLRTLPRDSPTRSDDSGDAAAARRLTFDDVVDSASRRSQLSPPRFKDRHALATPSPTHSSLSGFNPIATSTPK